MKLVQGRPGCQSPILGPFIWDGTPEPCMFSSIARHDGKFRTQPAILVRSPGLLCGSPVVVALGALGGPCYYSMYVCICMHHHQLLSHSHALILCGFPEAACMVPAMVASCECCKNLYLQQGYRRRLASGEQASSGLDGTNVSSTQETCVASQSPMPSYIVSQRRLRHISDPLMSWRLSLGSSMWKGATLTTDGVTRLRSYC
ncbi:hypothetical protein K504DRAFT_279505 [Pleomassaria siparia CBS 279.74]|uniref:Uncharacterized protein n=1 Tax=Pleomassaria siparia CBS 279.74 TaxID=1314801 RepID=A0A6G1KA35_9PLEO|nr:hypothetical protein K504DRAFT_279505 [Pleomassaria siparia CBS 279.74]